MFLQVFHGVNIIIVYVVPDHARSLLAFQFYKWPLMAIHYVDQER